MHGGCRTLVVHMVVVHEKRVRSSPSAYLLKQNFKYQFLSCIIMETKYGAIGAQKGAGCVHQ